MIYPKSIGSFLYNTVVSRSVTKAEIRAAGKGAAPQKAMDDELARLIKQGCFDFKEVFESKKLRALCQAGKRKPCHIGLVFGICVEKAYHLQKDDPNYRLRRFKGRYVY